MKKILLGIATVFALSQAVPAFAEEKAADAPKAEKTKKGGKKPPKEDAEKPADAPAK